MKKTDFDEKIKTVTSNKNELNQLSKKIYSNTNKSINKQFDMFSILNGAKYFSLGIFQNHSVFILAKNYIKHFSSTTRIESWKSNGMSKENIENITKSDSNFASFIARHEF